MEHLTDWTEDHLESDLYDNLCHSLCLGRLGKGAETVVEVSIDLRLVFRMVGPLAQSVEGAKVFCSVDSLDGIPERLCDMDRVRVQEVPGMSIFPELMLPHLHLSNLSDPFRLLHLAHLARIPFLGARIRLFAIQLDLQVKA